MGWHSITLPGNEELELASIVLIQDLERVYQEADSPEDARVFHRRGAGGSLVYYLSPLMSKVAGLVLLRSNAAECEEPPSTDRLVRVKL